MNNKLTWYQWLNVAIATATIFGVWYVIGKYLLTWARVI